MTTFTRNVTEVFVVVRCYKCAVSFAIPEGMHDNVRNINPGESFYCPSGHGQVYSSKSYKATIAELERQTIRLREERDTALAAKEKAAKATKALKKRVKAGTCPCCNRTFRQLSLHMKHQHPEFAEAVHEAAPT